MINSIIYNEDEKEQITNKINSPNFSSQSWGDDDLDNLKVKIKEYYLREQGTTCPYCKRNLQTTHGRYWDIEHIIPRSKVETFMFEPKNLCMSCVDCNGAKSNKKVTNSTARIRYPLNNNMFFIVHPHLDVYEENLIPIRPGFYYVAKSEKGAKTIETCNLNRFYATAGFGANDENDEKMFLLTQMLQNTDNDKLKNKIRREIAELAIKGAA